ncbi:MAG: glutaredoxin 3 [Myxococcota bacterium]
MARVVIYTTRICVYCRAAKQLFEKKDIEFEEIDVTTDPHKRAWLVAESGQRTVPQIFIDEKSYGGFTDVLALDQRGELDPLLGF